VSARPSLAAGLLASAVALVAADAAAGDKYALALPHFNIQYVAGGLAGFLPTTDPTKDLDAEAVEDRIVTESFEPVLDLFDAHPDWATDVELQGYMLDVLAARHPAVLAKLARLAKAGRIEVVSFHYSDQLFMAFPPEAWIRSEKLNRATFEKHGVPLSDVVFCQEGQAGPGMAGAMVDAGYRTLLFPKNLFYYQHGDAAKPAPLYELGPALMLTTDGVSYDDGAAAVEATFWFVDDGELMATGGVDPYIPEGFFEKADAMAKREADLEALAKAGYAITTVSRYVEAVRAKGIAKPAPPLLDGTWQPKSTDGIHRWLGGFGLWWKDERDDDVRTLQALAGRELAAAEVAAASAGIAAEVEIEAAYRLLALGEVSDSTGINCFRGEVEYGIAHAAEALRVARDVVERAKAAAGVTGAYGIDPAARTAAAGTPPPAPAEAAAPLALAVDGGDRPTEIVWREEAAGRFEVAIRFGAGDARQLSVTFPGTTGDIVYTPGLAKGPSHVARSAFSFDHYELALSDGLIGLGGGRFAIEDQATTHAAAKIVLGGGDVTFADDTAPSGEETTWVFHLVEGADADAAAEASAINVARRVWR
jgi:hypothetical protein